VGLGLDGAQVAQANAMLREGGAVVFVDQVPAGRDEVRFRVEEYAEDVNPPRRGRPVTVPALFLHADGEWARAQAVVSPQPAEQIAEVQPVGVFVDGPVSRSLEKDIEEAVDQVQPGSSVMVERGYQPDDAYRIVMLVLAGLGAVLMLGGTLTATFLALADARPDLATLASPSSTSRGR